MLFSLTLYLSKNPESNVSVSAKILSSTTVFNIESEMFLEQQISTLMISKESCGTEDQLMMMKIQFNHLSNKLHI